MAAADTTPHAAVLAGGIEPLKKRAPDNWSDLQGQPNGFDFHAQSPNRGEDLYSSLFFFERMFRTALAAPSERSLDNRRLRGKHKHDATVSQLRKMAIYRVTRNVFTSSTENKGVRGSSAPGASPFTELATVTVVSSFHRSFWLQGRGDDWSPEQPPELLSTDTFVWDEDVTLDLEGSIWSIPIPPRAHAEEVITSEELQHWTWLPLQRSSDAWPPDLWHLLDEMPLYTDDEFDVQGVPLAKEVILTPIFLPEEPPAFESVPALNPPEGTEPNGSVPLPGSYLPFLFAIGASAIIRTARHRKRGVPRALVQGTHHSL